MTILQKVKDGKKNWYKAELGRQDERRDMSFEIGLSRNQEGQRQRRTVWTRKKTYF